MTSFTVISDSDRLGLLVLGMNREELDALVDYLEDVSPKAQREDAERFREAEKNDGWIAMEKVHATARKKL